MSYAIRPAQGDDLDAITAIENSVFAGDRLSRLSLRRYLAARATDSVVATVDGAVAGYAMLNYRRGSPTAWLFTLAVGLAFGRRGLGGGLLGACEEAATRRGVARVRLEVRVDNAAGVALYERCGYRRFGTIEDYYEDGAAAFRYEKRLDGSRLSAGPREGHRAE